MTKTQKQYQTLIKKLQKLQDKPYQESTALYKELTATIRALEQEHDIREHTLTVYKVETYKTETYGGEKYYSVKKKRALFKVFIPKDFDANALLAELTPKLKTKEPLKWGHISRGYGELDGPDGNKTRYILSKGRN
jgi:hypothetical protein